jgi:hypothetical protein
MTSLLTMHVNEMMWLENRRITNNTIGAAGFVNICRRQESTEFRRGFVWDPNLKNDSCFIKYAPTRS